MSRIAYKPIELPKGVEVTLNGQEVISKGPKGSHQLSLHHSVNIVKVDNELQVNVDDSSSVAMAGTMRSLVHNAIVGVSEGFTKKLTLIGVGYRAQAQGDTLNLSLGFSHPVNYKAPEGIKIETPTQQEVVISGVDKQRVGQVAAEIRAYRPPEPYKGKGVRYADERVIQKEAKKK